jgi:hypothetical protein
LAKKPAKKNRTRAVSLIRKHGEFLGFVEAADREAAGGRRQYEEVLGGGSEIRRCPPFGGRSSRSDQELRSNAAANASCPMSTCMCIRSIGGPPFFLLLARLEPGRLTASRHALLAAALFPRLCGSGALPLQGSARGVTHVRDGR